MASKEEKNLFERLEDGRRSVIGISILTAVCLFGDSMLYVVLPIHFREAGLVSLWEVGILLSVNRLVRLPLLLWLSLVLAVLFTATASSTVADAMACDAASQAGNRMLMAAYTFAVDLGAALGPLIGYASDGLWGPFAIYRLIAVAFLVTAAGWFVRRGTGVPSGLS